jgi:5-methylcytosine-specific restriction endonuclease McrA
MSWSEKRPALPPDWQKRRIFVFARDNRRCQLAFEVICLGTATEVDHIDGNGDHHVRNLRAVCKPCHTKRSQEQAADAQRALWANTRVPRPPHPGLL